MSGETCAQIFLIAFNFVFMLSGFGVLSVGAYVRLQETTLYEMIGDSMITYASYILIAAGGVVMIVSMVGYVGAVTKNKKMLFVYCLFLMLTFLLEATAGIMGYLCHDQVKETLDENVKEVILKKYGYKENKLVNTAVDYMQQEFECCGYDDSTDWSNSKYYLDNSTEIVADRGSSKVPVSCCIDINKPGCNNNFDQDIFTHNCFEKLKSLLQDNLKILGAVGVGVCLIELVGLVLSILLIKKSQEEDLVF